MPAAPSLHASCAHRCAQAKKNILQLVLPAEVLTDASKAERSQMTGHLVLTCPKLHPIVTSKAPERRRNDAKPVPAPAASE